MNEIGLSNAQLQLAPRPDASVKEKTGAKPVEDGKALPKLEEVEDSLATTNEEQSNEQASPSKLGDMVSSVNGYVQSIQRDLQFTVDQDLEKTVVKVVDSDSGKLIRQIPEDVFLDLARNLMQNGEFQLLDAQG